MHGQIRVIQSERQIDICVEGSSFRSGARGKLGAVLEFCSFLESCRAFIILL